MSCCLRAVPTHIGRLVEASVIQVSELGRSAGFKTEGRHLVIYADPRKAGRFVAGAVKTNDDGAIEGFTLKVRAVNF